MKNALLGACDALNLFDFDMLRQKGAIISFTF